MHAQAARGEAGQPRFGPGGSIPGLEGYSHEQIMEMYMKIKNGEVPEELKGMARGGVDQYNDADGNPIIDEEGGAMIQPNPGFVVKTKDMLTGGKIFINFTSHDIIESRALSKKPFQKLKLRRLEPVK